MSVSSTIDSVHGLVTTRVTGRATPRDIRAHQDELAADPDFDPSHDHLFDLSEAETLDVSSADIRALTEVKIFADDSRRAVVAPKNLHYGLSRMYQAIHPVDDSVLGVFRTRAEAFQWLGIDEPRDPEDDPARE